MIAEHGPDLIVAPSRAFLYLDAATYECKMLFMGGYVYIMASRKNGTLYTGVTSNLEQRVWEHREGITGGFARRYGVSRLVWYRDYADIRDAIEDEHRIKRWRRKWKLELIEAINPEWNDLYETLNC